MEGVDALQAGAGDSALGSASQRQRERDPGLIGIHIDFRHRGVPHTALRHVEHSLDADFVEGIRRQPQIGQRILHLATVVELGAAHHLVRHAAVGERLFHHAALRVGSVEHREIAPTTLYGTPP